MKIILLFFCVLLISCGAPKDAEVRHVIIDYLDSVYNETYEPGMWGELDSTKDGYMIIHSFRANVTAGDKDSYTDLFYINRSKTAVDSLKDLLRRE